MSSEVTESRYGPFNLFKQMEEYSGRNTDNINIISEPFIDNQHSARPMYQIADSNSQICTRKESVQLTDPLVEPECVESRNN